MQIVFWFLVLHFYTFICFLVYLSFHVQVATLLNDNAEQKRSMVLREPLDKNVTAIHVLHRSKRKVCDDDDDEANYKQRAFYGVQPVPPTRAQTLGFKRRLLSYKRKSQIYVPELSANSRRCDLWNQRQDVRYLVKCDTRKGEEACFNCVESRRYVRHCVHLSHPIRLSLLDDQQSTFLDVPANITTTEGYCLSSIFANTVHRDGYRPADSARNCNPNTGEWLLARLSVVGDTAYNWLCRCRYPNLMTNQTSLFSDCVRPVGCAPHGRLDDHTIAGRVNPYTEGSCVCEAGYRSDRDPTIGPVCVSKPIVTEEDLPQDVYRRYRLNLDATLAWPRDRDFLDPRVATVVGGNSTRQIELPNPCRYDAQTGRLLDEGIACKLISERDPDNDDQRIAYCVSNSFDAIPVRSDRDYLRNNNGRYANACLRVHHTTDTSNTRNAILSYQTSLQHGENPRPDFGLLFEHSDQLDRIVASIADQPAWRDFTRHIEPPEPVHQPFNDPDIRLFRNVTRKWFSAYEQTPLQSRRLHGLMDRLLNQIWRDKQLPGGVIYNLRDRVYYWYKVNNPFGSVHWNNGLRSEIANNVTYASIFSPGSAIYYDRVTIDPAGFAYAKGTVRPRDYEITGSLAVRACNLDYPTVYPCREFVFPFASGAYIDDEQFSKNYYHTICPIFSVEDSRDDHQLDMPFLFNVDFDLFDSTLTLHLRDDKLQRMYVAAERLCGNYKKHRTLMRGRLQGTLV